MKPYEHELEVAVSVAEQAGSMILAASSKRLRGGPDGSSGTTDSSKKNRVDLVTETDQAVEKMVIERLNEAFPSHKFIGEESFAAGKKADLTDEPTWICDPIDGTTNFTHAFPNVCISIGLVVEKVPTVGVVFNPFTSQLYTGVRGQGAFLNRTVRLPLSHPSRPPPLASLGDALIAVEWGSDRRKDVMEKKARSFVRLAGDPDEVAGGVMCHSLRAMGSAALNYCQVAAGSVDMYWEIGCWAWDVCAGVVIAREAGAQCYGRSGGPFDADALMSHYFFVIRDVGDPVAQDRLTRDFFAVVDEWDA